MSEEYLVRLQTIPNSHFHSCEVETAGQSVLSTPIIATILYYPLFWLKHVLLMSLNQRHIELCLPSQRLARMNVMMFRL